MFDDVLEVYKLEEILETQINTTTQLKGALNLIGKVTLKAKFTGSQFRSYTFDFLE
jgi:hypothetical protein